MTTGQQIVSSTITPDPWTECGYADWKDRALEIRREWMRMMGMDDAEIDLHCTQQPPTDLDEELAHYNTMFSINKLNERQE
jgi:hypothetical protein